MTLTEGEGAGKKVKLQIWVRSCFPPRFRDITDVAPSNRTRLVKFVLPLALDSNERELTDKCKQESFRSITRSYYRGAGGALLIFDITSKPSFLACRGWLDDLRQWGEDDLVILLVGNKGDLCLPVDEGGEGQERGVMEEEAKSWVEEEGLAGYVETSAKSGSGVEEAFDQLTREVHRRHREGLAARRGAAGNGGGGFSLGGKGTGKAGCC